MNAILTKIETSLNRLCEWAAYIPMVIFVIITYEVIARYFFNSPTSWAWVISKHLFLVMCLFGGIYAFIQKSHIRIEMLYERFSPAKQMMSRLLTLILFIFFMGIFVWKSAYMAMASITGAEVARGAFAMPIYPFKILMPLVGLLLLLQGVISIIKEK